ncbi:hypothetical protein BH10PSE18_BH10PSE18_18720 [soil metagenome]
MSQLEIIETIAAILGAAGSLLLAFNGRHAGWGFVLFLASNAFWLVFGSQAGHWRFFVQQLVFTFTSLLGVWRWLIQPRLVALQTIFDHIAPEVPKK